MLELLWSPTVLMGLLIPILLILILFVKHRYTFWSSKGICQLEPTFLLGNFKLGTALFDQYQEYYKTFKKQGVKFGGIYTWLRPVFVPIDQELIKNILIKDFEYFVNHQFGNVVSYNPLSAHLINLEDDKWKSLRAKLTPTFTSGKMKMMFPIFVECTEGLNDILDGYIETKQPIDIKEVVGRFTTDVIGNCAFGLDCNSMKNPDSEFRKFGKKIFDFDVHKLLLILSLPKFIKDAFHIRFLDKRTENFFVNQVRDMVKYREKNNVFRKDFMHLMIQLKNRGKVADDGKIREDKETINTESLLTMSEIVANAFVFFIGGLETSSTTMSFAFYELARHKDIQDKLREEITRVLNKHDNKITYEAIQEMTYLDQVIKETLRLHPPFWMLVRVCNKDYKIPGTDLVLKRGTSVNIPVSGIHMDEEFYPDPKKFDPDRFIAGNKSQRPSMSWIPFGEGPRQCIGLRFGVLQSKVGMVTILKRYEVSLNSKTRTPLVMDPSSAFVSIPVGGVWLNVTII